MDDIRLEKRTIQERLIIAKTLIETALSDLPTAGCEYWDTESNYCALYRPAAVPTADLSEYCDKLWKTAYERGKAEAHPRTGKWKEVQVVIGRDGDFTTKEYECEICGYRQYFPENYCGRCGTRMEE